MDWRTTHCWELLVLLRTVRGMNELFESARCWRMSSAARNSTRTSCVCVTPGWHGASKPTSCSILFCNKNRYHIYIYINYCFYWILEHHGWFRVCRFELDDNNFLVRNLFRNLREIVLFSEWKKLQWTGRWPGPFCSHGPLTWYRSELQQKVWATDLRFYHNMDGIKDFSVFCLTSCLCWTKMARKNVSRKKCFISLDGPAICLRQQVMSDLSIV